MNKERNSISSWSDLYLASLEELYGPFNLHPALTIADLCKEWSDNFRQEGPKQAQANQFESEQAWSTSYMDDIELLCGELNLHPQLSIEELCEEWKDCFRADGSRQMELSRRQDSRDWSESYLNTWTLASAS